MADAVSWESWSGGEPSGKKPPGSTAHAGQVMSFSMPLKHLLPPLAASSIQEWMFRRDEFVPVFVVHRLAQPEAAIGGHTPEQLRAQLAWLRRNRWQLLSLETVLDHWEQGRPLPARCAVFTVDDGFWDQYEVAGEVFDRFDCPLTYYIVTGFLDGAIWPWDDQIHYMLDNSPLQELSYRAYDDPDEPLLQLSLASAAERRSALYRIRDQLKQRANDRIYAEISRLYTLAQVAEPDQPPAAFRPMRWDQIRDLERRGHHIAPHSLTHRILTQLSDTQMEREVSMSRQVLLDRAGIQANTFAYPTGRRQDFGMREMQLMERLGFRAAMSTEPGHIRWKRLAGLDRYALPRFSVPTELSDFCQYVSWIEKLKDDWRILRHR